ncbi:hypothetical protein [Actinotalea fermentans]|uniref:Uncharacterized protein n=1 Tax=Actinotalea fermentans TaxID=43671 RepID=A0A511YYL9_9CELL|nr:hypothetical protein [Actinotalea fermentans]KGM17832.1 hypothetical protein N867_08725 [Actinotalea fermentans ATCC 43279 = JCM 9966 = DSM 3133]GEN80226.1 hypothetical protein AFE02nite_19600 [Actinotalea fermentans]
MDETAESIARLDDFQVADVIASVRGLLDVALDRCAPGSAAALEICAAWEGLDVVAAASVTVQRLPSELSALGVLATARRLVRGAILRVEPLSAALLLAEALRHLDTAARILAAEELGEASPWA